MELTERLRVLYRTEGEKPYDLEGLTQLAHGLQAAQLAEQSGAAPAFVLAALLHDIGHLIQPFGDNPALEGIDHKHERLGAAWLQQHFGPEVCEPVRWHVEAKRYLCATKPGYVKRLSTDSIRSLELQLGPMSDAEVKAFDALPFAKDAVRLRYLDEAAKEIGAATPDLDHFLEYTGECAHGDASLRARGVIVLRNFFSEEEADLLLGQADHLGKQAARMLQQCLNEGQSPEALASADTESLIVVPEAEDPALVCRFEYLQGRSAVLRHFAELNIAPLLYALLGEAYTPFKDKENEKRPGGGAFRPHQDFAAYQAFGPQYNATAMITIDPATRANGCLEFATNAAEVAGAHPELVERMVEGRALFKSYEGGARNGDILDEAVEALTWEVVETVPRDLVVFDSFVPHRSPPNGSDQSRRAMFLTYSREREGLWYDRYYTEKRANFHDPKFHVSTPTQ